MRVRNPDAVARVEDRALCRGNAGNDFRRKFPAHLLRQRGAILALPRLVLGNFVRRGGRKAVAARLVILGIEARELVCLHKGTLHIERDVKPSRARSSVLREVQRLLKTVANAQRIRDHLTVLGHRLDRLADIKFLVAERPDVYTRHARGPVRSDLARDHKHRDGVKPCADHTGQRIRAAGACGHTDHSGLVVDARIALRRNRTGLLMMVVGNREPLFVSQRIV